MQAFILSYTHSLMRKYGRAIIVQHPEYFCECEDEERGLSVLEKVGKLLQRERNNGSVIIHNYSAYRLDFHGNELDDFMDYRLIRICPSGVSVPKYPLRMSENMEYFLKHPEFKHREFSTDIVDQARDYLPECVLPKLSAKEIVLVEDWANTDFEASAAAIRQLVRKGGEARLCGFFSHRDLTGCVDEMAQRLSKTGVHAIELEGMKMDWQPPVVFEAWSVI